MQGQYTRVKNIKGEELKNLLAGQLKSDITVLDVREEGEYQEGHIPGAQHIPLSELSERMKELKADQTLYVYCATGVRSLSAVRLLSHSGFQHTVNVEDGLEGYHGKTVGGSPETGVSYFYNATTPAELTILCWGLEEGVADFYRRIRPLFPQPEATEVFDRLILAEMHHQDTVVEAYNHITGGHFSSGDIRTVVQGTNVISLMEGGYVIEKAVAWAEGKTISEVLEFAILFEAQMYDVYMHLSRLGADVSVQTFFTILASEEKGHMDMLARMLKQFS